MKEYKKKWNRYKKGKVSWINARRYHPIRKRFINYIIDNSNINSVLEIGAGELIEAKEILDKCPKIKYSVVDVSKFFLKFCKKLSRIKAYKADMLQMPFGDKEFDLVYLSSVLEHSPNIIKTIGEIARISRSFYFSLFKWKMITGDLKSNYSKSKKYFTTSFNIDMLLELIDAHGDIEETMICFKDGRPDENFNIYRREYTSDEHRTADDLVISGKWRSKKING